MAVAQSSDEPRPLSTRLSAAGLTRLVVFAPNWLGDAVMALPALSDLRRHDAGMRLAVAARPTIAPLFELVAGVDDLITLQQSSWYGSDPSLGEGHHDAALLFPNSFHSAYLAWRAGIPERWGYATDLRRRLLTRGVPAPKGLHQTLRYQRLVGALGIVNGSSQPRLEAPDPVRHAARALLEGAGWDGRAPIVALAPGAAYGGAKRWPASSFAEVADRLTDDGWVPVVVGGPADRQASAELAAARRGRVDTIDLAGRTTLPQLAGVLALARMLVSNDSGAMHIAAALGTRVVAIFGPTDEHATRPLGRGACEVVTGDAWCRPCHLRECPIDHRCMQDVSAAAVVEVVRRGM